MSDLNEDAQTTPSTKATESPREKRTKLMGSGEDYRASTPHQVAALTWAIVELSDATTAQTVVDEERNVILARTADIAGAALSEQRTTNLMSFYATNPNDYPEGVRDQIKALLGIAGTEPQPEPEAAPEPRSNVTSMADVRRASDDADTFE